MIICDRVNNNEQLNLLGQQRVTQLEAAHWSTFSPLDNNKRTIAIASLALSDFLFRSCELAPDVMYKVFSGAEFDREYLPNYHQELEELLATCDDELALHRALRLYRTEAMAHIAISDVVGQVSLDNSLQRLSSLADALILSALKWLKNHCKARWGTPYNANGEEQELLVYGMGKLGGEELNFSSDIDLIFVYPEMGETQGARKTLDNQTYFTRLGQKLISALNQQTADGFVYRVDMRLRPFGESGPLVLSFAAMEDYYQEQGRDWERYAMLKARLIGGGKQAQQLSTLLRPFVYRRYIDFSVIESLRKMKNMISQEVRRKQLTNNIKLGAGGIREIEFIVQVFQLIRGGRVKALQQKNLLTVLPELVNESLLPQKSAEILENAYRFLRRAENIIQALDDKQTQTLPDLPLDQLRLITAMQIDSWSVFIEQLKAHMEGVHKEFSLLIGEEAPNQESIESIWETLWLSQWESREEFKWQQDIAEHWQEQSTWQRLYDFKHEIDQRTMGQRGRQIFDKLMPRVLWRLHHQQMKEKAVPRVLQVLAKIVSRTAYLELLFENEGALIQLIKLCDKSDWISEYIAKFPILLDELIDPKLLHNPPALSQYTEDLQHSMLRIPEDDVESQMEGLRQFKQAQQLRIAAADISEVLPLMKVSDHLTALAEAILTEVIQQAWQQLTVRFGQPNATAGTDHKGFAVIGYGKMGGIELGYGSDLDLVFIHDSDANDYTNGDKQISSSQFYVKLAQKIMHIFNARMSSGILYELDMRLRPSGNSGVLVIHVDSFADYQLTEAWTWEHQALVRSRIIYGHELLAERFNTIRRNILSMAREPEGLKKDVVEMREKMRGHIDKSTETDIDLKHGLGGLVDIEFLAQYLVLNFSHEFPALTTYSDNVRIFEQLAKHKILTLEQSSQLVDSYCQLRNEGHRAVLQNEASTLPASEFKEIAAPVVSIYHRYLHT
ncbi:bifunctional [glutamate--ammonia ligase]-adenylyl-L-tyrosine phosphorylase/[glutamate--ammonia-ligase] adenylyltransferase [Thalassotalea euphylliae]|uniref:bifunctional [glutamate--ammonia ligase]-adenylyl-L-tyrosine phosphorylase/[glutamate--ammonia-ligase] adenylyltransferase n=1 Tax=Thalassotalea euphylliae TaxID=1655234 RepID=UPI0036419A9B